MPFLKRMHRASLLPLVLLPRICVRRGWMRTRATQDECGWEKHFKIRFLPFFFAKALGLNFLTTYGLALFFLVIGFIAHKFFMNYF